MPVPWESERFEEGDVRRPAEGSGGPSASPENRTVDQWANPVAGAPLRTDDRVGGDDRLSSAASAAELHAATSLSQARTPEIVQNRDRRLRRLSVWFSSTYSGTNQPKFLIRRAGGRLEQLIDRFVTTFKAEERSELRIGEAAGAAQVPGAMRTIRVVNRIGFGHLTATDLTLQRQGDDLFVAFSGRLFMLFSLLRLALFVLVGLALTAGVILLTTRSTGLYQAWVQGFATSLQGLQIPRVVPDQPIPPPTSVPILRDYVLHGDLVSASLNSFSPDLDILDSDAFFDELEKLRLDPVIYNLRTSGLQGAGVGMMKEYGLFAANNSEANQRIGWAVAVEQARLACEAFGSQDVPIISSALRRAKERCKVDSSVALLRAYSEETREPWTAWQLFLADPKQFFIGVGGFPTLMALLGWVAAAFAPTGWLKYACNLLGWPTPDVVKATAEAHSGYVMRVLGKVQTEMGIDNSDIIQLGSSR